MRHARRFWTSGVLALVLTLAAAATCGAARAGDPSAPLTFCKANEVFTVSGNPGFFPANYPALVFVAGSWSQSVMTNPDGSFDAVTFDLSDLPNPITVYAQDFTWQEGPFTVPDPADMPSCNQGPGPPSAATSSVSATASPAQLPADGTSTTGITVLLEDANGIPDSATGQNVTLSTTLGTFAGGCQSSCVAHDNGDGTYTATLTAPTAAGTATITGSLSGTPIAQTASVQFNGPYAAPAIVSGPASPTTSATAMFAFTGASGASFQCSVDGGAYAACTSPFATASLANGAHTFRVTQSDALHPVSQAATYSWTITPPSGCTAAGTVWGDGHWKFVDPTGQLKDVHVQINAQCQLDHSGALAITNTHFTIDGDASAPKVDAHNPNIASVSISGSDATVTGTYAGTPFTVTVHDGGSQGTGPNQGDTMHAVYGAFDTANLALAQDAVTVQPSG